MAGKEIRNLTRIVLGAYATALRDPTNAPKASFTIAMMCLHSFVDFHFIAQYTIYTSEALNNMDGYLHDFHGY